ncbi:protein of unknown function [Burkholderia multivorans]
MTLLAQILRAAHGEHAAAVHQRNAIAARRLVHEVRRDENGHALLARQLDQMPPEHVARAGIDARGRFVQDQHFRLVQARGRQLQPLADAERQRGGPLVGAGLQLEAHQRPLDGLVRALAFHPVELRVQVEVLPHRQLLVQRERLRHVADLHPRVHVGRVDRLAEQRRGPARRVEQAGQHFHRRRLAAAVRAEEAEDLVALDPETHVIDRNEAAEATREPVGDDRGRAVLRARRDHEVARAGTAGRRQERHVRTLQVVRARALEHGLRAVVDEHAPAVHRDQMLEALRLFHVGSRDDHAHAAMLGAQIVDERPELAARQRIDAGGRFIEDQQVGIVHERAAQAELLLHPARQLARRPVRKRRKAGGIEKTLDACRARTRVEPEQTREEIDVLVHRERRVQIAPEPLRHEGDARQDRLALVAHTQVRAEHRHVALLDALHAGDDAEQRRLADAVRADQADRRVRRQRQRYVVERKRRAIAMRQVRDLDRARRIARLRRAERGRHRSAPAHGERRGPRVRAIEPHEAVAGQARLQPWRETPRHVDRQLQLHAIHQLRALARGFDIFGRELRIARHIADACGNRFVRERVEDDARVGADRQLARLRRRQEDREIDVVGVEHRRDAAARGQHRADLDNPVLDPARDRRANGCVGEHGLEPRDLRVGLRDRRMRFVEPRARGLLAGLGAVEREPASLALDARHLPVAEQLRRLRPFEARQPLVRRTRVDLGTRTRRRAGRTRARRVGRIELRQQFRVVLARDHRTRREHVAFVNGQLDYAPAVLHRDIDARHFEPPVRERDVVRPCAAPAMRPPDARPDQRGRHDRRDRPIPPFVHQHSVDHGSIQRGHNRPLVAYSRRETEIPGSIHRIHINHGSAQSPENELIHSRNYCPAPDASHPGAVRETK